MGSRSVTKITSLIPIYVLKIDLYRYMLHVLLFTTTDFWRKHERPRKFQPQFSFSDFLSECKSCRPYVRIVHPAKDAVGSNGATTPQEKGQTDGEIPLKKKSPNVIICFIFYPLTLTVVTYLLYLITFMAFHSGVWLFCPFCHLAEETPMT